MTPGAAGLPSVLTAVSARWDGPVVAAVEASRQLTIARRCADLADLLAAAASGLGRVALVSGQLRGLTLSTVATLRDGGVEVVGLADPDDDQGELRLWQLGVRSVVSATAAPHDLVAALLDAAGAGHHAGARC
jgi:DNA-binding NarL/FixJ family response regulator